MNLDCCNNCRHKESRGYECKAYCRRLQRYIPHPAEDICSSHIPDKANN